MYKSGHIYLVDKEPTSEQLAQFAKPVQFDVCKDGKFYSIIYDKDGNKYVEETSKISTGFIKIGDITQNDDQISIGIHPSGFNHWRINGSDITSTNPVNIFVDPVENGKFRIDYIFGNSAGGIFILPGAAGKFAIEPNILNYPDYAFLYRVLVTPDGFFVDDSTRVKTIGDITASSNSVIVGLHSSGTNTVIFNGVEKSTTQATPLPFTPVSTGKIKVLNVYALPTTELFYLAQGVEGDEAVEPILPEGSLFIRRIIVTDEGPAIDPATLEGFKEKDEDNWTRSVFTVGSTFNLQYSGKSQSFLIYKGLVTGVGSGTTKIGGIMFESSSSRSIKFLIYNITGTNIVIEASSTDGLKKGFSFGTPYTLKSKKAVWVQYNPDTDLIDILDTSIPFEGLVTDSTLKGGGITGSPAGLSDAKNAEITGKENASNKVSSWSTTPDNDHYPSEKLIIDSLVTQAQAESQTPPATETKRIITQFSIWKLLQSLTYIILKPNFTTAIANRLRSDGNRPYYANNSAVERGLAYDDEKMNLPSTNGTFAIQKSGTDISFIPTFSTIENLFFDQNGKWAFPVTGATTYSNLRTANVVQKGQSARTSSYVVPIINYTFDTTNTVAFRRGSPMHFNYTKTFKYIQQFDISSSVSTTRILVGLSNMFATVDPTNVSADTLIRTIGICKTSSSNNLAWIWNDATGSANVEDMGSGFPANDFNSIYRLTIDSSTAGVSVSMKLDRINKTTGAITSLTKIITSDFYVTDTIYPILYCCDSAATGTGLVGDYGIIGYANLV